MYFTFVLPLLTTRYNSFFGIFFLSQGLFSLKRSQITLTLEKVSLDQVESFK